MRLVLVLHNYIPMISNYVILLIFTFNYVAFKILSEKGTKHEKLSSQAHTVLVGGGDGSDGDAAISSNAQNHKNIA